MLLAIDVGNTNTLFAIFDDRRIVDQWRCATNDLRTADEYFVWLSTLLGGRHAAADVDSAIISSVVPNAVFHLESLCRRYFACEPLVVGTPGCRLPVPVRVDEGAHVGSDRLVNAAAAYDLYGGDLTVVDFGTATTFDVVDSDGAYAGGAIAPGVELSIKALHMGAAALPQVDVVRPPRVVGRNTTDCMHSGVYWGYAGLIDGICQRIAEERGCEMKVVGTGGLAGLFAKGMPLFDEVNPDLTIYGLALIHALNRG